MIGYEFFKQTVKAHQEQHHDITFADFVRLHEYYQTELMARDAMVGRMFDQITVLKGEMMSQLPIKCSMCGQTYGAASTKCPACEADPRC